MNATPITPVNDHILVEQFDKVTKKAGGSPFASVVSSNNLGTVRFSTDTRYPVGSKVYFTNKYDRLLVNGVELLAMKTSDVVAKSLSGS